MKKKHICTKRLLAYMMAGTVTLSMGQMNPYIAVAAEPLRIIKTENVRTASLKSISFNYTNYTLKKGKTLRLKATPSPKSAKIKKITWKSSKKSIATVSEKGIVKGKKNGTATITATVKGTKIKTSCKIRVGTPVTKIKADKTKLTLTKGSSKTVKITVSPSNASNKDVSYTSSKKSVATVSSKGKITAKGTGTATITIKAKDGSGKKATIKVTVKPKETESPDTSTPSFAPTEPNTPASIPSSTSKPSTADSSPTDNPSGANQPSSSTPSNFNPSSVSTPSSSSRPSSSTPNGSTPSKTSRPSAPSDTITPSMPSAVSKPSTPYDSNASSTPSPSNKPTVPNDSSKPSSASGSVISSTPSRASNPSIPSESSKPSAPSGTIRPSTPSNSTPSVPSSNPNPDTPTKPSDTASSSNPSLAEADAQLRFVLTWEKNSENGGSDDLDAHLIGPDVATEGTFHTYYANRSYVSGNDTLVSLQTDDMLQDHTETTSVYKLEDGVYHFYVYDFSNQRNKSSNGLAASGAKVSVLMGDRVLDTYEVPQGSGTVWDVCTYDAKSGTLMKTDTLSYHPGESAEIGLEPLEAARQRLTRCYDEYEGVNFGSKLEDEIAQKMQIAKQAADATDSDTIEAAIQELENYFDLLAKSTQITDVSANGLSETMHIVHQLENSDSKEYSILSLYGESDTCPVALNVTPSSETAAVTLMESDKKEYALVVLVTDSETKAQEKYYVSYHKNIDNLLPTAVTDGKNTITGFDVDIDETENGSQQIRILVSGTDPSLMQPTFTFAKDETTGVYQTQADGTGSLTVTDGKQSAVYPVIYTQTASEVHLIRLQDDANFMLSPEESWNYDDNGVKHYTYTVTGQQATLNTDTLCSFNVKPEQYTIRAITDEPWNYEISAMYQGKTYSLLVHYIQRAGLSALPISGTYEASGETCRFQDISLQTVNSKTVLRLTGPTDSIADWSNVNLTGSEASLSYEYVMGDNRTQLSIQQDGTELGRYPIVYEKDISAISYTISSSDGSITDWDIDYDWDAQEQIYYILNVYGTASSLSNLSLIANTADAEVSFTAKNAPDGYAGVVTVTYQTQTRQYLVFYHQEG